MDVWKGLFYFSSYFLHFFLVKKKRSFLFLIDELLMMYERNDRDLIRRVKCCRRN